MEYILIAVSPFYDGKGWTDRGTGISFKPTQKIEPIRIAIDGKNTFDGIANSVRLNNLMLLKGTMPQTAPVPVAKRNLEELTVEELELLVSEGADTNALDQEIVSLKSQLTTANEGKTAAEGAKAAKQLELDAANARIADLEGQLAAQAALNLPEDNLENKTVTELKQMAVDMGLELIGTKKAEIIAEIKAAQAAK